MRASDLTKTAWLALLREGGWWTPRELAEHLGLAKGSIDRKDLTPCLRGMAINGSVNKRKDDAGTHYAVLPGCMVPRGISVGEVIQL